MPEFQQNGIDLFVEGCLAQMDTGREWFEMRVLPLSLNQLRWRSGIGTPSILECLSHLHHLFEHYVPKLEQSVYQGFRLRDRLGSALPFQEPEAEFLKQLEPSICIPQLTVQLSLFRVPLANPDRIVDQDRDLRNRYSAVVRFASELDMANTLVDGSIHPEIRSLGGVLALLAAYDRRHIWQAERVRKAPTFPV